LSLLFRINSEKIKSEVETISSIYRNYFSLTFDSWTVSNQAEYMAITIHYMNKDWELISRLLEITPIDDRKETTYLLGILNETLAT